MISQILTKEVMDKIQSSIQEMNTLGFDQISIRATILESTCFVYATNAPEGAASTVKCTSSNVEASVIGALEMLKLWLTHVQADGVATDADEKKAAIEDIAALIVDMHKSRSR